MKLTFLTKTFVIITSVDIQISAQEMKYNGTHTPNHELIKLMERDAEIFDKNREVAVRDSLRKEIISSAYFYHGIEGKTN